jgi:acyl-[acyl carrier protein]--UDP-N-acetylglucosamine O-acyltransferase
LTLDHSIIEDGAVIGEGASIGPYCIIGPEVVIGPDCKLIGHVHVTRADHDRRQLQACGSKRS